MKRNKFNYKYIYDMAMANFFILNGGICTGTGRSKENDKIFWCFDADQVKNIYPLWQKKCDEFKMTDVYINRHNIK
jgi:hypothetical protein